MGSGYSGLYGSSNNSSQPHSATALYRRLDSWAKREIAKLEKISKRQRDKFTTACVVIDISTGKRYYGKNGGMMKEGHPPRNSLLFGDKTHTGILPKTSLNKYPLGNCAEVHAVNNALNAGAKIGNLYMTTIHVTKGKYGQLKEGCENCKYAFKDLIKKNYAGWK